jgi:hypothetical protein
MDGNRSHHHREQRALLHGTAEENTTCLTPGQKRITGSTVAADGYKHRLRSTAGVVATAAAGATEGWERTSGNSAGVTHKFCVTGGNAV